MNPRLPLVIDGMVAYTVTARSAAQSKVVAAARHWPVRDQLSAMWRSPSPLEGPVQLSMRHPRAWNANSLPANVDPAAHRLNLDSRGRGTFAESKLVLRTARVLRRGAEAVLYPAAEARKLIVGCRVP